MWVSDSDLATFTGKRRPSAQRKVLRALGVVFVIRPNGTIALRTAELDRHTLSKPERAERVKEWEPPVWEMPFRRK